ncbi:hypothetical protein [Methylobacterium hispanicum]|uniref:hypothetical protein n=1 Tax=Methylobacterium hispanicum TaxID=270350 RepID=UPI002F2BCF28
MGSWGLGSFDGDGALDRLIVLRNDGVRLIGQARAELWADTASGDAWRAHVAELDRRLGDIET